MAKSKRTAPETVAILRRLNQQSAGWLVGLTARTLRDLPAAPRNDDGTYDGQALVAWAKDRLPRPELTDDDYERLLVVQETLYDGEPSDGERLSIIDTLRDLRSRCGEQAWLIFVDLLIREWADVDEQYRTEAFAVQTEADIRRRVEQEVSNWKSELAKDRLEVATVCDDCSKLRRGRQWVTADPPEGHVVQRGICPPCHKRHTK